MTTKFAQETETVLARLRKGERLLRTSGITTAHDGWKVAFEPRGGTFEVPVDDKIITNLLAKGWLVARKLTPDWSQAEYVLTDLVPAPEEREPRQRAPARRGTRLNAALGRALQPTFFEPDVAHTKHGHPETSHIAAAAASDSIDASRREVLALFTRFGRMTTQQLIEVARRSAARAGYIPYSNSRYRSACPELARLGLLRRAGTVPTGRTSRNGVVTMAQQWELVDAPRAGEPPPPLHDALGG
jgi:hypothetical protein